MYEREKTIDVLRRLKSQESKPNPDMYNKPKQEIKKEEIKIVNLPQRKVESLIQRIDEIRRKMKNGSGGGYFNLYYDLKNAEENFVREAKVLKEKKFDIPQTTMRRVDEMLNTIKTGDRK
ncbi:MAG: hypothetical protein AABW56_01280 [Nanoarchaeota archaeon]